MDIRPAAASALPVSPASAKTDSTVADRMTTEEKALRVKAQDLEASFLAEMLKLTGLGKTHEGFGGGVGEEQFSSFLTDEYARIMAKAGGIGLAESIFHSLQKGAEHAK